MTAASEPTTGHHGEAALRRDLGVPLGIAVVVNATIGTGIFKTPAHIARLWPSLAVALGVWIAGGVIALAGALSLAELAAAIPRTGGLYEYLRRAYGPDVGFLYGWTKLTLLIPSAVGSFARLAAEALAVLTGAYGSAAAQTVVSMLFVLGCAAVNLVRVRTSVAGQALVTVAKFLGVALLAALGLSVGHTVSRAPSVASVAPTTSEGFAGVAAALVAVMWAYDGWADLANLAGEVRAPERSLPRALTGGTVAIIAVYLLANVGYARAIGFDGLRGATTGQHMAAAELARAALGTPGATLLAVLILVSCVGGCMSSLLTGSRVFVPMASDGVFWHPLGRVSARAGVPVAAVVLSAALGAVYLSVHSFEQLTDAFVVGYFPFYILAVAAVFVLRRRERDLTRPFRVPGYPVVPAIFLLGATTLLVGALHAIDRTTASAFGVLFLGFPVRWVAKRVTHRRPPSPDFGA